MPQVSRFASDGRTALGCPPGHWGHPRVPWYKADGLDAIAADRDLPDGLALLEKVTGHGPDDLAHASRAAIDQWWAECYRWAGISLGGGGGDVVAHGAGIYSPGHHWDAQHKLTGG